METQENLLSEISIDNDLIDATPGQRFANLLLDMIGVYIFGFVTGAVLAIPLTLLRQSDPEFMDGGTMQIVLLIAGILLPNLLYYTFFEKLANGKTLGKLVTKTRAVRYDGSKLTFKNALLRSICRWVPFDGLTLLFSGAPWHDDWTNTRVVKD